MDEMNLDVPGSGAVSALHGSGVAFWRSLYEKGRLQVRKLPRPVISVGNLTLGGTGKTPFVESLARLLSDEGYLVCILSRGYKGLRQDKAPLLVSSYTRLLHGPSEAGDEAFLLARKLPGVPVVVGDDKHEAGLLALKELKVHVFLVDDGFQTWGLHRDVDIVLVDATDPWGGGHLLPKGRLREPIEGLRRASLIGITRAHQADATQLQALRGQLLEKVPNPQVFFTKTMITGLRVMPRGLADLSLLRDMRVLCFAGLGNPEQFFRDVETTGETIAARRAFADHHPYTGDDVRALHEAARDAGAHALVTTEKDAVRLPPIARDALPIYAVRQRVEAEAGETLMRWLISKMPNAGRPA